MVLILAIFFSGSIPILSLTVDTFRDAVTHFYLSDWTVRDGVHLVQTYLFLVLAHSRYAVLMKLKQQKKNHCVFKCLLTKKVTSMHFVFLTFKESGSAAARELPD